MRGVVGLFAVALAFGIAQDAVAVNKCTGKDGAIVYQDAPCANTAAAGERVKTWSNSPGPYTGVRNPAPDTKLTGPPQAGPMLKLYCRWIDAERLAMATGRIALPGPVAALQALQREAESTNAPECLADAKEALVKLTAASTNTMLKFMHSDDVVGMVYQFLDRPKLIDAFEQSIGDARCR